MSGPTVLLVGSRRNGTTLAFELLRDLAGLTAFYEPLHPFLPRGTKGKPGMIDLNPKGVWDEYRALDRAELEDHFAGLGAPRFPVDQELDPAAWTEGHAAWIRWLSETAEHTMLQPVRVSHHLSPLVEAVGDHRVVWIHRTPEDVVHSLLAKPADPFAVRRVIPAIPRSAGGLDTTIRRRFGQVRQVLGRRSVIGDGWSHGARCESLIGREAWTTGYESAPVWERFLIGVIDQVTATEAAFAELDPSHRASVQYEDLCADPDRIISELASWLGLGPPTGPLGNRIRPTRTLAAENDRRWTEALGRIDQRRVTTGLAPYERRPTEIPG